MTPLKEEAVIFEGPCGNIEGRLGNGDRDGNGVLLVLHPHPQYGGSMSNNVVKAVIRAGQQCGLVTLRINFRGVGRSEGGFGGGVGELDDVRAALNFLRQKTGRSSIVLLAVPVSP